MAERITLDPAEVATAGRTVFDLTPWISDAGVDWGDGDIQAYMADLEQGSVPVDYRIPNRTITVPLKLRGIGGTAFATVRSSVQAKAALFQRRGGWLKRVTAAGGTVYADVVNATVKLPGSWSQANKDYDLEAELTLEALPDFYGDEVTLADHVETSAAELVFTETTVTGDYPARVRVVVDDDQGQAQLGLMWGFRNTNYSSASTARLAYEAEALQPLDTAAKAALSGASGGTVVTHGTLATNWTPVLDMRGGGTAYPTHAGTYRWRCRYRTTSGTAVQLRGLYDVGDMVLPAENPAIRSNAGTQFFVADLGELRLDPPPVGTHRWNGMIQAKGDVGGENVSLDRVWLQPVDEGAGVLRAPLSADVGLVPFSARDEFNQTAGTLTGKVMPVGGTWAGAGDADDFSVETSGHTAQRTAVSDTSSGEPVAVGRIALAGVATYSTVAVQVDVKFSAVGQGSRVFVFARYTDANNFVLASITQQGSTYFTFDIQRTVGGSDFIISNGAVTGVAQAANTWYTLRFLVDTAGRAAFWVWPTGGSPGSPLMYDFDAALASGGAIQTGRVGFGDHKISAGAVTRSYNNFAAWVPTPDAVITPSQPVELRWDGMFRKDTSGSAYGPVSWVEGDLPRLPPGGTTEVFVKASRGDFQSLPDTAIDDISGRASYRPCWVFVPGS